MTINTFFVEERNVYPTEFFFLNAVEGTLVYETHVAAADPDAASSTVSVSGDWELICDHEAPQQYRIPVIINDIRVQVRDAQGN